MRTERVLIGKFSLFLLALFALLLPGRLYIRSIQNFTSGRPLPFPFCKRSLPSIGNHAFGHGRCVIRILASGWGRVYINTTRRKKKKPQQQQQQQQQKKHTHTFLISL